MERALGYIMGLLIDLSAMLIRSAYFLVSVCEWGREDATE
jgi:hypothetical protein